MNKQCSPLMLAVLAPNSICKHEQFFEVRLAAQGPGCDKTASPLPFSALGTKSHSLLYPHDIITAVPAPLQMNSCPAAESAAGCWRLLLG